MNNLVKDVVWCGVVRRFEGGKQDDRFCGCGGWCVYVRRAVCKTAVTKGEIMAFRETGVISDRSVLVARRRDVGETSNQVKKRRGGWSVGIDDVYDDDDDDDDNEDEKERERAGD